MCKRRREANEGLFWPSEILHAFALLTPWPNHWAPLNVIYRPSGGHQEQIIDSVGEMPFRGIGHRGIQQGQDRDGQERHLIPVKMGGGGIACKKGGQNGQGRILAAGNKRRLSSAASLHLPPFPFLLPFCQMTTLPTQCHC